MIYPMKSGEVREVRMSELDSDARDKENRHVECVAE